MGGGDTANLEKGVCAWVWASERERERDGKGVPFPRKKKDDRTGSLQTASQIVRQ